MQCRLRVLLILKWVQEPIRGISDVMGMQRKVVRPPFEQLVGFGQNRPVGRGFQRLSSVMWRINSKPEGNRFTLRKQPSVNPRSLASTVDHCARHIGDSEPQRSGEIDY
jgi:hypothetical protein